VGGRDPLERHREGTLRAAARSPVHERDVAAVAVRALTGSGHDGAKHVLTGPEMLIKAEQVRAIGEAIGRPLRFEEGTAEEAREEWVAAGLPPRSRTGSLTPTPGSWRSRNR
jgi:uncharacterized protein YbjT (DUF2867 family)